VARFQNGLRYEAFRLEEVQSRRYDDVAVAIVRQSGKGTHQGQPVPEAFRATLVLLQQAGGWRIAGIHISFVAGTPGAPSPGPRG
jgi:ketosteroid isomerase-like protein